MCKQNVTAQNAASHLGPFYLLIYLLRENSSKKEMKIKITPDVPQTDESGLFQMSRIVRKPDFCLCEKLISAFVFATRIVQFLFYLNPKFQASRSFLSLYRPVCVGPGRKPRRPVFSLRGSNGNNGKGHSSYMG